MSYFAITMQTRLNPKQVASEISGISRPASLLDSFILRDKDRYTFIGSASASHFKLMRNIGSNICPAILLGGVRESGLGSNIRVKVRPHWGSCAMLAVLLAFLFLVIRSNYSSPPFWAFAMLSVLLFFVPFFLGAVSSVDQLKTAVRAST